MAPRHVYWPWARAVGQFERIWARVPMFPQNGHLSLTRLSSYISISLLLIFERGANCTFLWLSCQSRYCNNTITTFSPVFQRSCIKIKQSLFSRSMQEIGFLPMRTFRRLICDYLKFVRDVYFAIQRKSRFSWWHYSVFTATWQRYMSEAENSRTKQA